MLCEGFKVVSQQKWPFFWAAQAIQPENNFLFTFLTKWAVCPLETWRSTTLEKWQWVEDGSGHTPLGRGLAIMGSVQFLWGLLSRPALSFLMDSGHFDAQGKPPKWEAVEKRRNGNLKSVILFFDQWLIKSLERKSWNYSRKYDLILIAHASSLTNFQKLHKQTS